MSRPGTWSSTCHKIEIALPMLEMSPPSQKPIIQSACTQSVFGQAFFWSPSHEKLKNQLS